MEEGVCKYEMGKRKKNPVCEEIRIGSADVIYSFKNIYEYMYICMFMYVYLTMCA